MMKKWSDLVHKVLKREKVRQVSFVPDAGHSNLIRLCEKDKEFICVRLSTEEEGVSLSLGAWLGGQKSVLLMQSSGVGNTINMLSMLSICQSPLPMLITMRGDWSEYNPWQVPMGQATAKVLEDINVPVFKAYQENEVLPMAEGAIRLAFNTYRPTALLIGQRVLGAKTFGEDND